MHVSLGLSGIRWCTYFGRYCSRHKNLLARLIMPRKARSNFHKGKKEIGDCGPNGETCASKFGDSKVIPISADSVEKSIDASPNFKKNDAQELCAVDLPSSKNHCVGNESSVPSESNGAVQDSGPKQHCFDNEVDSEEVQSSVQVSTKDEAHGFGNLSDAVWSADGLACCSPTGHDANQKSENADAIFEDSRKCSEMSQNEPTEVIAWPLPKKESKSPNLDSHYNNGIVDKLEGPSVDKSDCLADLLHSTMLNSTFSGGNVDSIASRGSDNIEDSKTNDISYESSSNSNMTSEMCSSSHTSLTSEECAVEQKFVETLNENVDTQEAEFFHVTNDVLIEKSKKRKIEIMRLKEENGRLQQQLTSSNYEVIPLSEATADIYEVQMAALEKTITQLQREVDMYRDRLSEHDEVSKNSITNLKRDFNAKLEKLSKKLESSDREKETMVVKYAQSEKTVLIIKKSQEETERKLRENGREREILMGKVRSLTNERARLNQAFDCKSSEIGNLQRDNERLKEEILSKDIKIKWGQNKLKTEMDAHKETLLKLDKIQQKLKETREESEQVRRDCQAMIRTYQESEEIKSNSLDLQLREKETELELERQEKSDQEEVYHMMRSELDALKKKHKFSLDESNALTMKVQCLERERLDYEQNLSKLKEQLNVGQQEIVDLQAKLAEMENLKTQISREKEKVVINQSEIERLRQANVELQIDMEACRRKEGELLEFTERLTSKNVTLQSEYSCLEAKFQAQEREFNRQSKLIDELEQKNALLTTQLQDEQQLRKQETQLLARKLAEKTKAVDNLNLKLEEQNNDNAVLRRRNASSVRELTREIQMLRRRLENYEQSRSGATDAPTLGSRSSSTGSLDTASALPNSVSLGNHTAAKMVPQHNGFSQDTRTSNSTEPPIEPSRQMLIERIVKLQRAHARKNEKIEFLEEHVNQLVNELKKKSKVIQNYIMREEAGALATVSMDQNKAELSKKGGIMASLYTSHQVDDGMTIELSLEISRKLQTVLEDTLLKNITLKENIKTLGDEIERLTKEKRQLKN